jgi:hypothetical protein
LSPTDDRPFGKLSGLHQHSNPHVRCFRRADIRNKNQENHPMNGCRTFNVLLGMLWAGACSGLICANVAFAAVQDSRFEFSADGTSVDFDVRDVSRREVLSRLFAGTDIEVKWVSSAFADEPMSGRFNGTSAAVARQLLGQTNFVIVHDVSNYPCGDRRTGQRRSVLARPRGDRGGPAASR